MEFKELEIAGVYEVTLPCFSDERGEFIKPFHFDSFEEKGLETNFKESFYTKNNKGVIRGMHFQGSPYEQTKIVYVVSGEIVDVLLDLRKDSVTYGKHVKITLTEDNNKVIYIPKGIAHGYCCITAAKVVYMASNVYNPEADDGIAYNSFGCEWPVKDVILSNRDKSLIEFNQFSSPF